MNALDDIGTFADELTLIRKDLHAHPELGLQEHRTAGIVADYLNALGLEVHTKIGVTGVVGVLEGKRPGRTVGLRADMDALPMQEKTNLSYASKTDGVMHACGHDAHTAILLGAARHLAARAEFCGRVIFIFQPAEEGLGGARAMLADGLFDRFPCDEIFGIHNEPNGRLGEVRINSSMAYAGADFFDVKIEGVGAHAAYPHEGTDVIAATSALIQAFNSIVSRDVPASEQAIVSVTRFSGGNAYNIMPDEASLGGTVRFLKDNIAELIQRRMQEAAAGVALAHDVRVSVQFDRVFNVLNNDPASAQALLDSAIPVVGAENAAMMSKPDMGSEDFADMLNVVPGAYFILGHGGTVPLHNPGFVIDDDILPIGAAILSEVALQRTRIT